MSSFNPCLIDDPSYISEVQRASDRLSFLLRLKAAIDEVLAIANEASERTELRSVGCRHAGWCICTSDCGKYVSPTFCGVFSSLGQGLGHVPLFSTIRHEKKELDNALRRLEAINLDGGEPETESDVDADDESDPLDDLQDRIITKRVKRVKRKRSTVSKRYAVSKRH